MIIHYVSSSGTWYEHNKCELIKIKMIIGEFLNQDYKSYFIIVYRCQLNSGIPVTTSHIEQYEYKIT